MIIALLAAAAAQGQPQAWELPPITPIYCMDSKEEPQPVKDTTLASFRNVHQQVFGFSATLTKTGPRLGKLQFRGGDNNAETVTYDVAPYGEGLALLRMRVRLTGLSETLTGDDMCWRTFATTIAQ